MTGDGDGDDDSDPADGLPVEELLGTGTGPGSDPAADVDPEVAEVWDRVVSDTEATAAEYREAGWETLRLHPGDVTPIDGADRTGLDVLVPDNEFDELQSVLDGTTVRGYEAYRTVHEGVVYLLVAVEAVGEDRRVAVLFPAYYDPTDARTEAVVDRARREGVLRSYLRVLSGEYVEVTHDDPESMLPP